MKSARQILEEVYTKDCDDLFAEVIKKNFDKGIYEDALEAMEIYAKQMAVSCMVKMEGMSEEKAEEYYSQLKTTPHDLP